MSDLVKRLRAYKEPAPLRHDIAEAAATLEAQAAEIERLRASELAKENERLKQWIDLHRGDTMSLSNEVENFRSEMIAAESRAEKAESALAEAVEVMRPFADEAAKYDPDEGDSHEHAWGRLDLTIGHLRTARRFIASQEPAEQEK